MLLNRISLRVATAVGSAAMVAGATFAVSAFADSGGDPGQATAAALPADPAEAQSDFFAGAVQLSEEDLAEQRAAVQERIEQADGTASVTGTATEEKEEPEEEDTGSDSGTPAPSGDPKGIAQAMLADYGWGADQFDCLEPLWEKESNWNPSAENPSSGAYGIPQALPGNKMATAGSDWQTNPATQIEWGLGYIEDRYGSPCEAWNHSQANGWY
ncbi:aggregation-promoting factor C-terminal-like domain-containing protein [Nocardiopsis trehalosi]|uniref:aggregation-promoting factor C-terminal-like domain-containing protein n=1 Tax=Nocardiopsis trehalosi TaxID=109329 RepID=UPI000835ABD3|nr:transglycosylase SLT domain-containing protein [Nocardiopsis trehalosi]